MNPHDGLHLREVTVRTRKKKKSHSKVFAYLMRWLREGKHIHVLRYKDGTNKTQFEVHFYDMKVHHQWHPRCLSLFKAMDQVVKEGRRKGANYNQSTKNRFKSNMRKLENKYIKFLYEDKISTALRVKTYLILKPEDVQSESSTEINSYFEVSDESEMVISDDPNVEETDQNVEEGNSSFIWLPGSDFSRSMNWSGLKNQDRKGNVMVSSVSETSSVSVERTDFLKVQDGSEFCRILQIFPDLKIMDGYQLSNVLNSSMKNDNDSEKNRDDVKGNYIEESNYPCLLGNEDIISEVPSNSYQNDFTLDFEENSILYADPLNGEKSNIEVSSNEIALDSDLDFDREVCIETISDIDWCNEFLGDLTKFNS